MQFGKHRNGIICNQGFHCFSSHLYHKRQTNNNWAHIMRKSRRHKKSSGCHLCCTEHLSCELGILWLCCRCICYISVHSVLKVAQRACQAQSCTCATAQCYLHTPCEGNQSQPENRITFHKTNPYPKVPALNISAKYKPAFLCSVHCCGYSS